MGITRHFLDNANFVLTRAFGELSDIILRDHVIALNQEASGIEDLRELADCREINDLKDLSVLGASDAASLEIPRPNARLAILTGDSNLVFGLARAFQTFSEDKRRDVQIFRDFDSALDWLSDDESDRAKIKVFISEVFQPT